jgi:thiamine biosynthesis lipoprotein
MRNRWDNAHMLTNIDRICARGFRPWQKFGSLLVVGLLATTAQAEWVYRDTAIMGTRCAVELWSEDLPKAEAAIASVFDDMRRIDALMSTWKPDTQLSLVNRDAGRRPVVVDQELFDLVRVALDYSKETGGAFDITYASVGYLYDFKKGVHPGRSAIAAALPGVNYTHVKLDAKRRTIRFLRPGMRIDLGGIAKGYAVDRGIDILRKAGFERAMVNSGGDTRIIGDRFGKPWIVGLRNPDDDSKSYLRIPLTDAAISTSGDYERYFDEGGVRYHHIIDPKTGDSARLLRSATIIGPTALRTDGLSTSVFVLGPQGGIDLINRLEGVDAVVVTPAGKVLYSKGLEPPS